MKALVLGATGMIGNHVVRELLKEGIAVRAFIRKNSNVKILDGLNIEFAVGDILYKDSIAAALRGCNVLFHAAAHYPIFSLKVSEEIAKGLTGMRNALEAAEEEKIEKIIYTSSPVTIGPAQRLGCLSDESSRVSTCFAKSAYLMVKYRMEEEALKFAQRGLPIVIVNPTGCFGEYDVKPTTGRIILQLAKKQPQTYVNGNINVVDVRDVAKAEVSALFHGKIGERYILGNYNTTIKDLLALIAQIIEVPPPKWKLPIQVALCLAYLSEYIATSKRLPIKVKMAYLRNYFRFSVVEVDLIRFSRHMDSSKAVEKLKMPQSPVDDAIHRAFLWFKENGYLKERKNVG